MVGGDSRAQLAATGGVGVRGRAKLAHNADNKIRHLKGKYTVKEEVIRRVEHSYPCKLVETAVKVTFPGMKSEVLVSFLGYKEPNLMQVSDCATFKDNGHFNTCKIIGIKTWTVQYRLF